MLLGAWIHIFTDHNNLKFSNLTTQSVLRWQSYVGEEYLPKATYWSALQGIETSLQTVLISYCQRLTTEEEEEYVDVSHS